MAIGENATEAPQNVAEVVTFFGSGLFSGLGFPDCHGLGSMPIPIHEQTGAHVTRLALDHGLNLVVEDPEGFV